MSKTEQQMATSDFNLNKLNTKQLSEHIAATIQMKGNMAIFGRRGSGKTQIAKQEIKKSGTTELYINLSVLERVDLGGYPNVMGASIQQKFINFILPAFYEKLIDGNKTVTVLFDEVDKADPSLWAPLLEFTQFHSVNGQVLPNLGAIIMTGNLISEGGARPSLPLLDRAEKYLVEADASLWLDWAGRTGAIHPSITAYINDNPKDLFGAVNADDRYADPSPRGWENASKILFQGESLNWNPSLLNLKVSGCVGKDAGIKYSNYYEHYQQLLPMIEKVFKGESVEKEYKVLEPTKKLVAAMIACARFATILDQEKTGEKTEKIIANIGKFLKYVDEENVLVAVRSQVQISRLVNFSLDDHPEWAPTLKKINDKVGNNQ